MYLRYIPPEKSANRFFFAVLLAAGKKALTKNWKVQTEPTINNLKEAPLDINKMEMITFSVNLKMDIFIGQWERWVKYVKLLMPDFGTKTN